MAILISESEHFNAGAFTLNEELNVTSTFDQKSIFLTLHDSHLLKEQILRIIEASEQVLKICSFIVTDHAIYEAILNKARNGKTAIFILTQLDDKKLKDTAYLTDEEIKDNTSQTHLGFLSKLYEQGVHVRASTTAHAKFIVADRNRGLITSANLTTPSLTLNVESGIYLNDSDSMELDKLFDVIFQQGTTYRQYISYNKTKTFIVQNAIALDAKLLPNPAGSNLRYSYESDSKNLYDEILRIVNVSERYVFISAFSIVGLENLPELTEAIKDALSRGVQIKLFCRGMNHRADHLLGCETLTGLGCEIFGDGYNHSKGIVSEKSGMIFTANIDGYHGLKNGFEVGLVVDDKTRAELEVLHIHLMQTSIYKFEMRPTRARLFEAYRKHEGLRGIKPPDFPKELSILLNENLLRYENDFSDRPIFVGQQKGSYLLIVGRHFFHCTYDSDGVICVTAVTGPVADIPKFILKYSKLKIQIQQHGNTIPK